MNIKKAFSLIELSIVILIIGILVAGVTQSSRLVKQMRLSSARAMTNSSPVPTIKNLVAWYESTSEKSFNDSETSDQSLLKNWYDINLQSSIKLDASQTVDANKPIYTFDEASNLPIVKFIDQDFFNLPDGTVPYNNMPYTIFFVSKADVMCVCGVLGSGTYLTINATNAFRYDTFNGFYNYWWNIDLNMSSTITQKKLTIIDVTYDLAKRDGFVDGVLKATTPSSNRASTAINNTIGRTAPGEFLIGSIGEIIIYDRALSNEERKSVEGYLSKKWSIKLIN